MGKVPLRSSFQATRYVSYLISQVLFDPQSLSHLIKELTPR